jgi:hypothetical protein
MPQFPTNVAHDRATKQLVAFAKNHGYKVTVHRYQQGYVIVEDDQGKTIITNSMKELKTWAGY